MGHVVFIFYLDQNWILFTDLHADMYHMSPSLGHTQQLLSRKTYKISSASTTEVIFSHEAWTIRAPCLDENWKAKLQLRIAGCTTQVNPLG